MTDSEGKGSLLGGKHLLLGRREQRHIPGSVPVHVGGHRVTVQTSQFL